MSCLEIPIHEEKSKLFQFLKDNEKQLISQKKTQYFDEQGRKTLWKHGSGVSFSHTGKMITIDKTNQTKTFKANTPFDGSSLAYLQVLAAINTTNIMDSHYDVHLPGLWKKSLSENKNIKHLKEHTLSFNDTLSDGPDLKAYTQKMAWSELGYNFPGITEVLIFDSIIRRKRNQGSEFMINQYASGYVNNHSVGMQYVMFVMCINDDSTGYGAEYEAWQKYYPEIVNKDFADDIGFFWAVKEAKVIEGSAVPIGSCWTTPTIDNNVSSSAKSIDYAYLANNFKLKV